MDDFSVSRQRNQCNCNDDDTIIARGSVIEEIRMERNTGYVTIAYQSRGDSGITRKRLVTLVVTRDTVIRDRNGRNLRLSYLRVGMIVDAEFSSAMTFSIPPQARAYRITVVSRNTAANVTIGFVLSVELRNGFLNVASANNNLNIMRFVITDSTKILNRNGRQISLRDIRQGQRVRVEHADFQTRSIPPQTTAFVVQII